MKQQAKVIFSVSVSFVLAVMLVQSYRYQRETDWRITELQQTVSAAPATDPSIVPEAATSIILDDGTDGSEFVRRQHNLDEILNLGWKFIDQRNPAQAAKAVEVFTEGIANVDSGSPELYNGLGRALLIAGDRSGAIAAWRKGLELAPNFSDMESGIGWAYWSQNDPARAKDAWQKALRINPHSADAWSAMAWIDLALGECAEAKNGFQELTNFDPKRQSWAIGLSMAQGNNTDVREISAFFPLPPRKALEQPTPVELVSTSTRVPIAPGLKN